MALPAESTKEYHGSQINPLEQGGAERAQYILSKLYPAVKRYIEKNEQYSLGVADASVLRRFLHDHIEQHNLKQVPSEEEVILYAQLFLTDYPAERDAPLIEEVKPEVSAIDRLIEKYGLEFVMSGAAVLAMRKGKISGASHALAHDATLVLGNVRNFASVMGKARAANKTYAFSEYATEAQVRRRLYTLIDVYGLTLQEVEAEAFRLRPNTEWQPPAIESKNETVIPEPVIPPLMSLEPIDVDASPDEAGAGLQKPEHRLPGFGTRR